MKFLDLYYNDLIRNKILIYLDLYTFLNLRLVCKDIDNYIKNNKSLLREIVRNTKKCRCGQIGVHYHKIPIAYKKDDENYNIKLYYQIFGDYQARYAPQLHIKGFNKKYFCWDCKTVVLKKNRHKHNIKAHSHLLYDCGCKVEDVKLGRKTCPKFVHLDNYIVKNRETGPVQRVSKCSKCGLYCWDVSINEIYGFGLSKDLFLPFKEHKCFI